MSFSFTLGSQQKVCIMRHIKYSASKANVFMNLVVHHLNVYLSMAAMGA